MYEVNMRSGWYEWFWVMIMMILMKTVVMRSISLSMWVIDDDRMSWRVSMNWSWIVEWNDNWWEWVDLSRFLWKNWDRMMNRYCVDNGDELMMMLIYGVLSVNDIWWMKRQSGFSIWVDWICFELLWLGELIRICDSVLKEKRIGLNEWWLDPMTSERVDIIVLFWRNDIDIENQSRLKSLLVR